MNNTIAALALTAFIVLIISFFGSQTGHVVSGNPNVCPECNVSCPACDSCCAECPGDTTPYSSCSSCCEEFECPGCPGCPSCDSCCAECPECPQCGECPECDSCCPEPECPPEANEENCQAFCGTDGGEEGTGHLVFTEVEYDTPGTESREEWLEIYNPGSTDANLTGWSIEDNTESPWPFPDGTVIAAKSYITIARDSEGFYARFGCFPDLDSFTKGLNNDGDQLALRDNEGSEIDFVAWEGGYDNLYPEWDLFAGNNESIQRKDNEDTDSYLDWLSEQAPEPANC